MKFDSISEANTANPIPIYRNTFARTERTPVIESSSNITGLFTVYSTSMLSSYEETTIFLMPAAVSGILPIAVV